MSAPVGPFPADDERHLKAEESAARCNWAHTSSADVPWSAVIEAVKNGYRARAHEDLAAYFAELADQGVRLVDAGEVAEWLRGELADGLHEDDGGSFVAAFLARFGGGDDRRAMTASQRIEPGDPRAKVIEAMAIERFTETSAAMHGQRGRAAAARNWPLVSGGVREAYRASAARRFTAALAALEAEGWVLTDTREAERLRRALEVIAHPGLTPRAEPWSREVARCALANEPHAAAHLTDTREAGE